MKGNKIGKRIWHRCVTALSCLVVFCTTYALILPAVALEHDKTTFYCEKEEHQHTDECNHSKDPLCGQEEGKTQPGHTHGEECYEIRVVENQICGLEENENHQHNEQCFETIEEKNLICTQEEAPEEKGHSHSANCYLSVDPVCGKEEHTHARECESNKALKETKDEWENSIPKKLDEELSKRIVQVADSQLKYKEVLENFEIVDGVEKGYTRYGEWYGRPYEDWNIMFVSFVLKYAGVSNEKIPYGHDWNEWIEDLTKRELFEPEDYEAQNGDLVFFRDQEDENDLDKKIQSYVGIVKDHNKNKVIIGDFEDEVREVIVNEEDYKVLAYVHPKEEQVDVEKPEQQPVQPDEENPNPEEEPKPDGEEQEPQEIEYQLPEEFTAETEDFTLVLKPRKIAGVETEVDETTEKEEKPVDENDGLAMKNYVLPTEENMQDKLDEEQNMTVEEFDQIQEDNLQQKEEEENKPVPTLVVEKMDETNIPQEDQEEVTQLKAQSLEEVDPEQLLDLSLYKLRFFVGEQEVNLEDQKFDAELTPTEQFVEKYDTSKELEDVAPEAEIGTEYTIQTLSSIEVENNELKEDTKKEENSQLLNEENKTLGFSLRGKMFSAKASQTPNPTFTVQTYGNVKKNISTNKGDNTIPVVDMTNGTPSLGQNVSLQHYKLTTNGKFDKKTVVSKIYEAKSYQYHSAPNISYFDILIHNGNYKLKEIWVLKDGKNAESNTRTDWTIKNPSTTHFTNRQETYNSDPDKYILIQPNTTIRLVYDLSSSNFSSNATFYDYDITEDGVNTRVNSKAKGINNPSNYTGSGSKYAFGNSNTGTGLADITWKKNHKINSYNGSAGDPSGNGFVFDMVTGVDTNGNLKWNSGIIAPKIFGSTSQIGKKVYPKGNQLTFTRQGDTYTLSSVSGANVKTIKNLDTFNHPKTGSTTYTTIWTNNFWPLDGVKNTDPHAGTYDKNYNSSLRATETYKTNGTLKHYPPGDDGLPHNNLFGMTYDIDFTLDQDYVGPLEYFFYGDDDLWVFLGEYNEATGQYENYRKICDLGGVKPSRGAHVDLRTSILPVSGQNTTKKYRLKIYYTERGLSGSTCYMEFTLPSVSGAETGQATGGLNIYKETEDLDQTTDFTFNVKFSKNGQQRLDDYAYTKYDANNHKIEDNLIIASNSNITLKKGEYISISYLPIGTTYTVSELNVDSSTEVYTGTSNGNYVLSPDKTLTGTITQGGNTATVYFKNVRFFKLPETGGFGINPPLIASGAGLMTTSVYVIGIQKKKRRKK